MSVKLGVVHCMRGLLDQVRVGTKCVCRTDIVRCVTHFVLRFSFCKFDASFPGLGTYPEGCRVNPSLTGHWRAGRHRVAWTLYGRVGQPVWVVLHGGPGSGSSPTMLQPFDLRCQQVLLVDQRGCGQSLPSGGHAPMGLHRLVEDLEALRQHLGIGRWSMLAGSWGAVVALAYAERHARHLERVVFRGAFSWRKRDMRRVYQPRWTPRGQRWDAGSIDQLLHRMRQLFHFGVRCDTARRALVDWQRLECRAAWRGAWRSWLASDSGAERSRVRQIMIRLHREWRRWQSARAGQLGWRPGRSRVIKAQVHFRMLTLARDRHRSSVRAGLNELRRHAVSVDWVHGQWDAVCDPQGARQLHARLEASQSRWHWVNAGHLADEPAIQQRLRERLRSSGRRAT